MLKHSVAALNVKKSVPPTEKLVVPWPDAQPWARLHIDWAYIQEEVGNTLIA